MQTEINYKQLGKRIAAKRMEQNLLQKDFAELLGVAVNHLSDVERGVKKPSLELLMRISCLLDTPVDFFLLDFPHVCCQYIMEEELASVLEQCSPQSLKLIWEIAKKVVEYQETTATSDS